jgi:adenine-specific DNA-methyltransferase
VGERRKKDREKVAGASPALVKDQIEALKALFPEAVCEGKVDFDKLKATLGEELEERRERYSFTWAGKQNAIRLLQAPSRATLIPAPEESVDFETTGNLFIEGDNLEVLKLLYKPYFGRVKMIYIDPPYNTGNDFIYPDNFADPLDTYLKLTGQKDAEGNLLTSNPETSGRYHSSWLSMMYPRLFLARQLLREDGVIFVSIDDHEVHNLRMLMNEVFGEENFIASISWQKKQSPQRDAIYFSDMHDYILVYARKALTNGGETSGWTRSLIKRSVEQQDRYKNPDHDSRGPWVSADATINKTADERPNLFYSIERPFTKEQVWPSRQRTWAFDREKMNSLLAEDKIWWGTDWKSFPRLKSFLTDVQAGVVPSTLWLRAEYGDNQESAREIRAVFPEAYGIFDTPKPTRLVRGMLELATSSSVPSADIVLDFFSGSATTAQAILDLNREDGGSRRFILVQLPEPTGREDYPTIADIGKERIRRVIAKLKKEKAARLPSGETEDLGFRVFKLAASHHKLWAGVAEKEPTGYGKEMGLFQDPLLPGWSAENILWEVALKEGFCLNSKIEKLFTTEDTEGTEKRTGKKETKVTAKPRESTLMEDRDKIRVHSRSLAVNPSFYRVTDPDKDQHFILSLDETLNPDHLKALNLAKEDLFICRDTALTDELAANLALQCRLKTI